MNLPKELFEKLQNLKQEKRATSFEELFLFMVENENKKAEKKIEPKMITKISPKNSRYTPKAVKYEVNIKAGGKCQNCGSSSKLEYDHKQAFTKKGSNEYQNIQLLCHPCNQRKAIKEFGVDKMSQYRMF